jgi:hypothetical protein
MPAAEITQGPLVLDLENYAGKWVAIRDGEVVASADSLEERRENPDVRREDTVYIVPERTSYFY